MTDREKLGKLLAESASIAAYKRGGEWEYSLNYEEIVDHFLSHGVTVKEPNRPLSLAEARRRKRERLPLYVECKFTEMWHGIHPLNGWVVGLAWLRSWLDPDDEPRGFFEENYGVYWRCWAEKPTEEERKAAEWEE